MDNSLHYIQFLCCSDVTKFQEEGRYFILHKMKLLYLYLLLLMNLFLSPVMLRIIVIYWPSTEPSIKWCTCVNRWRNSGSRWALENNITRCPGGLRQLETGCRSENQLQIEGFRPSVTYGWATASQGEKEVLLWSREEFGINIAVRPCLYSPLTHNKHHPFENKVWEIYILIKKCIRSLLKSTLPVDCFLIYLYIYTWSCIVAIQYNLLTFSSEILVMAPR